MVEVQYALFQANGNAGAPAPASLFYAALRAPMARNGLGLLPPRFSSLLPPSSSYLNCRAKVAVAGVSDEPKRTCDGGVHQKPDALPPVFDGLMRPVVLVWSWS